MESSNATKQFLSFLGEIISDTINVIDEHRYSDEIRIFGRVSKREWERYMQEKRVQNTISRYRRKNWLKDRRSGENFLLLFDNSLAVKALKHRIAAKEELLADDKVFLVIFDVPVGANASRYRWSRFLKQANFYPLQKSIWSTNRNVVKEVHLLIHLLKAEEWMKILVAESPDDFLNQ